MAEDLPTQLDAIAAQAHATGAMVRVLLTAPEGFGRTHALNLAAEQLRARRQAAWVVPCQRGPAAAGLLRALLRVPEGGAGAVVEGLMAAPALAAHEPERRRFVAEMLASLLGHRDPSFATQRLDAEGRREGAFSELARQLALHLAQGPVLLAFDDVHAADADSLALIDFLAHLESPLPLALVLSADAAPRQSTPAFAEKQAALRAEGRWQPLTLPPHRASEVEVILLERGCAPALATALAREARGNLGLALGAHALLTAHPELAAGALPASCDALRVESVRALGPGPFALARAASALGTRFPAEALAAAIPIDFAALTSLDQAGVLRNLGGLLGFDDRRVQGALACGVPEPEACTLRRAAGTWAAQALESMPSESFDEAADAVLPLALTAVEGEPASLWHEADAGRRGRAGSLAALEAAAAGALGVRRLVLLRRVADAHLVFGKPEAALAVLQKVGRGETTRATLPAGAVGKVLAQQRRGLLDRWESLGAEEAQVALELVRAECLSHQLKQEDTLHAFEELERRLMRLSGPVAGHLWVRWARSWCWFLSEILGRPADALKACERVRQQVAPAVLQADEQALAFVRAQEIACSSVGDFDRSRQLIEELLQLAQKLGDLREQCLGWNARAILHFGQGELADARRAFERSVELARSTGWLRREAIATHNLALVLTELGELDRAQAAEVQYAKLSVTIGNASATAEAPAVLAGVALARGNLSEADAHINQARKAAELHGWSMLRAWIRALLGRRGLHRFVKERDRLQLTKARNDLLAALDVLEEHSVAWVEEFDPGEVYALYAAALSLSGQDPAALDVLERGAKRLPAQNVVSQRSLAVGRAFVQNSGLDEALAWFGARGYQRLVATWKSLGR